jgi:methylated-DNA-[protein]-cysteine S-methyltransferase
MKQYFIYKIEVGSVAIAQDGGKITNIILSKNFDGKDFAKKETPLIKKAAKQLADYFEGKLKKFNLPLAPEGTAFQKKVWNALTKIPYGKTKSYKEIAAAVDNPKAVRAVGGANNKNPIFIVVPCHRVIGSDGSLTGYACGIKMKKHLLDFEKKNK